MSLKSIFPPADQETERLRREYVDLLKIQSRLVKENIDSEIYRKKAADIHDSLMARGQKEFVAAAKIQREAADEFFGTFNQTFRSRLFKVLERPQDVMWSARRAIREDMVDALTGRGKKLETQGLGKNSFVSRVFGADKFFDSDNVIGPESRPVATQTVRENPISGSLAGKEPIDILTKIEENTSELLNATKDSFKKGQRASNDNAVQTKKAAAQGRSSSAITALTSRSVAASAPAALTTAESVLATAGGSAVGAAAAGATAGVLAKGASTVGRMAGIAGAVLGFVFDGLDGWVNSRKWGTSDLSGVLGSAMTSGDEGIMGHMKNMGKYAAAGAIAGSVVPVVGTLAGGLAGAAIGSLVQFVGGEKLAKMFDSIGTSIGSWSDRLLSTNFVLDESSLKKTLDEQNGKADALRSRHEKITSELSSVNDQIDAAFASRDTVLLDQLQKRKAALSRDEEESKKALDEELKKIESTKSDIELAKKSYLSRVMEFLSSVFTKIQEPVKVEMPKEMVDRGNREVKKIDDAVVSLEKSKKRALEDGDRESFDQITSRIESLKKKRETIAADHGVNTNAEAVKSATTVNVATVAESQNRRSVVVPNSDNYPSEESRRPSLSGVNKSVVAQEQTIVENKTNRTRDMFEANETDRETKRREAESVAATGASVAANVVNQSSTVNNNISVFNEMSARNDETSFAAGIAGVRIQAR